MGILASNLWRRTVDLQSWSRKGFGEELTGTQWSGLAWRSSAEVSVHVSSHIFALNDRKDRQTELRIAAPLKSTTSIEQQKKEERLHSKRSPCKNGDGKFFATKCRQKHVCGGIALLAMFDRCWNRAGQPANSHPGSKVTLPARSDVDISTAEHLPPS